MGIEDQPPASTLLYLFADQVLPPDKAMSVGVEVPCAGAKVQRQPLTAGLFAIALWNLREHGYVTLEYQEKKRLGMFTTRQVIATGTKPGPRGGPLEGQLINVLWGGQPQSVGDLVYRWFGDDYADPHAHVVNAARQAAVALGVFEEVDANRGAVGSLVLGKSKLVPVCERREQLRDAATETLQRWQAFRTAEPQIALELEDDAKKAIGRRTEGDDDFD